MFGTYIRNKTGIMFNTLIHVFNRYKCSEYNWKTIVYKNFTEHNVNHRRRKRSNLPIFLKLGFKVLDIGDSARIFSVVLLRFSNNRNLDGAQESTPIGLTVEPCQPTSDQS